MGFGLNGYPSYQDSEMFPFPAIRFKEETAEITALRKREEGDWKQLSLDEKKACEFFVLWRDHSMVWTTSNICLTHLLVLIYL